MERSIVRTDVPGTVQYPSKICLYSITAGLVVLLLIATCISTNGAGVCTAVALVFGGVQQHQWV